MRTTETADRGINNSHGGSCLSLDDFDFAEKDQPEESQDAGGEIQRDADNGSGDFLAAFFRSDSGKVDHRPETAFRNAAPVSKRFAKKSQKERKRDQLQLRTQEDEKELLAVGNPKEHSQRWGGWASKSPATESSPSFADILTDEKAGSGNKSAAAAAGTKPKAGARNRKASWRQLSFDEESAAAPATAAAAKSPQPAGNPWKQLPQVTAAAAKDLSARERTPPDRCAVDSRTKCQIKRLKHDFATAKKSRYSIVNVSNEVRIRANHTITRTGT